MARTAFENLSTERFRLRMRPRAEAIYQRLFSGCKVVDLREKGVAVYVLDKEFGIDTLAEFPSGQWITVQEKYRSHRFLCTPGLQVAPPWPDFTQEYMNAVGTKFEAPGEWFKLAAQLYFYGWADKREKDFEQWFVLDVAKYKMLVETSGGLNRLGRLRQNFDYGKASFYCIPMNRLEQAWVAVGRSTSLIRRCNHPLT